MDSVSSPKFCFHCQSLPNKIENSGHLYLWLASAHSLAKVIRHISQSQLNYQLKEEQCLVIDLEIGTIEGSLSSLAAALTDFELKNTKALFVSRARQPQLQDFPKINSLSSLISLHKSSWILDTLAAERVTSQFQPIVYAENTSRIFGQEALFRGLAPDGSLIPPVQFFSFAAEADLLVQLDLLARSSAIRQAKQHQIQERIFINFTPTSIYDPAFCLRSTVQAIDEAGIAREQIVFEVVESNRVEDLDHLRKILDVYREAGFLVALDDFGAGYSNLNLLHQLRPDFIKLDMSLIRNVHQDSYKALVTEKILEIAAQLDIKTVAEGVETRQELNWVSDRGATFVQGYLMAKPSTVPATTLSRIVADSVYLEVAGEIKQAVDAKH